MGTTISITLQFSAVQESDGTEDVFSKTIYAKHFFLLPIPKFLHCFS